MGELQNLTLAGLFVSFLIAGLLFFVNDLNDNYSQLGSVDNNSLTSLNNLQDFKRAADAAKDQATKESSVNTEESEASFLTNAFTFGKFIFTGSTALITTPIDLVTNMVNGLTGNKMPPVLVTFLIALIFFISSFAVIRGVTGR